MNWMIPRLVSMQSLLASYPGTGDARLAPGTRPAAIASDELTDFNAPPEARRKLFETALALAVQPPWLPYLAGGADPAGGGFDCSGIGSTDGRCYRGQAANGYGAHDFRVPGKVSPSTLVGFGTPPGLDAG